MSPKTICSEILCLYASTACRSISFAQTISNPAFKNPKSNPPAPENKLTVLRCLCLYAIVMLSRDVRTETLSAHITTSNCPLTCVNLLRRICYSMHERDNDCCDKAVAIIRMRIFQAKCSRKPPPNSALPGHNYGCVHCH